METLLLSPSKENIDMACNAILSNDVVALPTETVYGLFANATSDEACNNIFKAKGRPSDNPLIIHIASYDMLHLVAMDIPKEALLLAEEFWPGPLTIILKKQSCISDMATAGIQTVGVRMPQNPIALEIISKTRLPLAGPSANRSGRPSPTVAIDVYNDLNGELPIIIDGGRCDIGVESTVISLLTEIPVILRPGYITKMQIEQVLKTEVLLSNGISEELLENQTVLSPGLKHKHYAPKATVTIVSSSFEKYKKLVESENAVALCFDEYAEHLNAKVVTFGSKYSSIEQAAQLFSALRKLDEINAVNVYATMPSCEDIGLAVYNRLLRACEFRVVNL